MNAFKRIFTGLLLFALLVALGFRLLAHQREALTADQARPDIGRMIETAMGRIYVQEFGPENGAPLLLAHGTAAWSGLWAETSAALAAKGYRAIAFDMPPFGFSQRDAAGDYARQTQARRILALTEAMKIQPTLVAHSFGAAPAAEAVMIDANAFAGFIMVNGAIGLHSHKAEKSLPLPLRPTSLRRIIVSLTGTNPVLTKRLLAQLLYNKSAATDEVVAILQEPMVIQGSTSAFADWLPSLLIPPKDALSTRPENWQAITLSTRLIWGDKDAVTPPDQGHELASLVDQGDLHMLTDVGHIPQIDSPAAFQALLLSVLSDMTGAN